MLGWLLRALRKPQDEFARSSRWPAVRAKFLEDNPCCSACGGMKNLEVHHVTPYHVDPSKELAHANLQTLCGLPRNCHWSVGHGYDWKAWRPESRKLAKQMLDTRVERKANEAPAMDSSDPSGV
jgi:5-methylcytosine-specific restriction endonuclease McrA